MYIIIINLCYKTLFSTLHFNSVHHVDGSMSMTCDLFIYKRILKYKEIDLKSADGLHVLYWTGIFYVKMFYVFPKCGS